MQATIYYFLSSLPALGELGTPAPMSSADLLASVSPYRRLHKLLSCLFLADDLSQREAFLAGETSSVAPAVLSVAQVRNEAALPAVLAPETEPDSETQRVDLLWHTYFHHAAREAERLNSEFLRQWVGYEVGLRNELARVRAKRLGLDERSYVVAADLGDSGSDYTAVVNEWSAADTPLAGWRVLMQARWAWMAEHDGYFGFEIDELAAYAAQFILLQQWRRVADREEQRMAAEGMPERMDP